MSTFTTSNATQGRLAPGHLRDAFEEMVGTGQIPDGATQYGAPLDVLMLTGLLLNCGDVMPRQLCALLDVPQGSSYAQGARAYRAANREAAETADQPMTEEPTTFRVNVEENAINRMRAEDAAARRAAVGAEDGHAYRLT